VSYHSKAISSIDCQPPALLIPLGIDHGAGDLEATVVNERFDVTDTPLKVLARYLLLLPSSAFAVLFGQSEDLVADLVVWYDCCVGPPTCALSARGLFARRLDMRF
jgi:hypothetical protein